jgi:hypothetical protein
MLVLMLACLRRRGANLIHAEGCSGAAAVRSGDARSLALGRKVRLADRPSATPER